MGEQGKGGQSGPPGMEQSLLTNSDPRVFVMEPHSPAPHLLQVSLAPAETLVFPASGVQWDCLDLVALQDNRA